MGTLAGALEKTVLPTHRTGCGDCGSLRHVSWIIRSSLESLHDTADVILTLPIATEEHFLDVVLVSVPTSRIEQTSSRHNMDPYECT